MGGANSSLYKSSVSVGNLNTAGSGYKSSVSVGNFNPADDPKKKENNYVVDLLDTGATALNGVSVSCIYFLRQFFHLFFIGAGRFIFQPLNAVVNLIRIPLAWRKAQLAKYHTPLFIRALVSTITGLGVATALIGSLVAGAAFAVVGPFLAMSSFALRALSYVAFAIYYSVLYLELTLKPLSPPKIELYKKDKDREKYEEAMGKYTDYEQKKESHKNHAIANGVNAVGTGLNALAIGLVLIALQPALGIIGIVSGIITAAFACYKCYKTYETKPAGVSFFGSTAKYNEASGYSPLSRNNSSQLLPIRENTAEDETLAHPSFSIEEGTRGPIFSPMRTILTCIPS